MIYPHLHLVSCNCLGYHGYLLNQRMLLSTYAKLKNGIPRMMEYEVRHHVRDGIALPDRSK